MDYGWNAFIQAMGVFDVLRMSLISITDINSMVSSHNPNETVTKALPFSLWSSNKRSRVCSQLIENEANEYASLVKLLYKALHNWQESNQQEGWPNGMQEELANRKQDITSLKLCANEYKDTIIKALSDLAGIKSAAEDTLNSGTNFDFQAFKNSFKEDLNAISASGSWLHDNIKQYHGNTISKLDLAKNILTAKMSYADVIRHMETVLFKTDLDAIFKLRTEAQRVKTNIQNWIVAGLSAISSFVQYFGKEEIESKIRNISLWRQPIVDLRTVDGLRFSYNFDETWRTWPISLPLQNLITPGGSKYISDILDDYIKGIDGALYEVQHVSLAAKEEAVLAFDVLWKELQSYELLSQIDESFVR